MNLSFSTRGNCALSFAEAVATARDLEFSGIEFYNAHKQPSLTGKGAPLSASSAVSSNRILSESGLKIACFDSSCDLSTDSASEATALIDAASDFGVPYVSVCALSGDSSDITEKLAEIVAHAQQKSVCVLLKTSGIFSATDRLRQTLDSFASDHLAALWDVHHTYRTAGESADQSIKNLGAYICHVHLRDSNEQGDYSIIGEGTLPIADAMLALSSINYHGFISAVWKSEWMEQLPDTEIIFAHFATYMSRFDSPRGKRRELYPNHDHSGTFVWKKDELLDLTFSQVLDKMADEYPDQIAVRYTTLDYTKTYSEFKQHVDRFARALMSLGVRPGCKVAVWATNVPQWFVAFWATTKIGAVLVTVNTAYKIHEAEYLLRQSDTHTLIMIESCLDSHYAGIIAELCPELENKAFDQPLHSKRLPFLRNVITVGYTQKGCMTFEQAEARADMVTGAQLERVAAKVRPGDVCNMQYTSGTTGFPKGVMLTHYNVINNGKCIGDRMDLSTADRMLIHVPMFHCFGMVLAMTASMTHGSTIFPLPYFSAKSSLSCIHNERITVMHGVPTMFIAMLNHPDYETTDFSHMRTGIMAGAGCPPELMRRASKPDGLNMRGIVSVYGQTECSPGNTMSDWLDDDHTRCDTVGYALPHIECKVIDPETGETVPDGVNGEFCARGYNIMKGYYKMPLATKEAIDEQGWLHSGDLACKDPDGSFRITGRLKDMIIRGGENIYPREIEEFVYTHPSVKDVQVIGVPDQKYGEEIMACIILKEGQSVTVEQMREYIMASMARHKVPRYIDFVDSFPMNAAGKIMKYKMREAAAARLSSL